MKNDGFIPNHIAIIMDGNRRWAKAHFLPVVAGHNKVANEILEPLIYHASELGVQVVTLWAFSTENWERNKSEVSGIMTIFRKALPKFGEKMHKKSIRIKVIGDMSRFDRDIQQSVQSLMDLTRNNTRITVVFALNYGGRDEIIRGIHRFLEQSNVENRISKIDETNFMHFLDTSGIPDPELIIRTGGAQRLSGFLPWQSVYSELYFPSWYMPEFTPEKLDECIHEFATRKRRFGK
jgi:undecaprenyl diphosphate synthase